MKEEKIFFFSSPSLNACPHLLVYLCLPSSLSSCQFTSSLFSLPVWCCQIIEHGGLPQSKNYGPYINADGACHSGQDSAMEGAIAIDGFMQVMRTRSFSTGESAEEGGGCDVLGGGNEGRRTPRWVRTERESVPVRERKGGRYIEESAPRNRKHRGGECAQLLCTLDFINFSFCASLSRTKTC